MSDTFYLIVGVACVALVAGVVLVQKVKDRDRELRSLFAADEIAHEVTLAPRPTLAVVPDGFTCLSCGENPALPTRVWCAVCAPRVDSYPAEPIERGGLR